MSNQISNETSEKKKGGNKVLIICIIIILLLLGVVIFLLLNKEEAAPKRNVVVMQDNVEEVVDELVQNEITPPGQFNVKQTFDWVFPDGQSASTNAYVENAETNTNDVYFDIVLSDTGETIFESPILPLGSHLEAITLDKDLDPGNYDCVLIYNLVDENQRVLSSVKLRLKIIVEN